MAKKTVATLRSKDQNKGLTKVFRAVKNNDTGNYSFKSVIVPTEQVSDVLAGKNTKA
jgi:hypothetical protein